MATDMALPMTPFVRRLALAIAAAVIASLAQLALAAEGQGETNDDAPRYRVETLQGRVVWLAEAMARRTGVRSVPEAKERTLAVETKDGQLVPLVEDVRGRAFRADEQLREMDVELVVRRYAKSPAVQIVRVYKLAKEGKFEVDYWCDLCAIAMFEKKPCECCQGPNRLRLRAIEPVEVPPPEK